MALAFYKNNGNSFWKDKNNEKNIPKVKFTIHKLNNRPKPNKRERIKIICCFSEFGCEIFGCLYCISKLRQQYAGQYVIVVGWYGREYLYRHIADEFWEIGEEFMWLRDYTRAFHHVSKNLKRIEEALTIYGDVIPSAALGKYAVVNHCRTCGKFWNQWKERSEKCPSCNSTVLIRSAFTDIATYKSQARMIPKPRAEMMEWASQLVGDRAVGIFARNRKTYGRNLPSDFYSKLITQLREMGYKIIWLGERQNTLPCPDPSVVDFSQMAESRDLERTLAIISKLSFTIQFWTASTRLSGLMGTPFLLFESPEQIFASHSGLMAAQEGKRLELCSFGPKKIVIAHYKMAVENQDKVFDLVNQAINEMKQNNWDDIVGLVEDRDFTAILQSEHYNMLT